MIDLIDPPFNYKKLPGMVLTILGGLGVLSGLGIAIAVGVIAGTVLLFPLMPILIIGGGVVAAAGAMWWAWVAQNDSEALRGCNQISQINDNQNFPSDDELNKSTLYFKVEKDSTIKACWYENDGSTDGIIKTVHITELAQCGQIIKLYKNKTVNYFDEVVSLLGYPPLTIQALNVEKAALASAIPTELVSPVDMPSSSHALGTGVGEGFDSTRSSTPFAEPSKTEGEKPTVTPTQQPESKDTEFKQ